MSRGEAANASGAPAAPAESGGAHETAARRRWMSVLAKAPGPDLAALVAGLADLPETEPLRGPEVGTVMVRGRAGGTGEAFNLGEMTVTRCTLRLADGAVGHAIVQGRDTGHARHAALMDGLMQGARASEIEGRIITPLAEAAATRAGARAARAAQTKVEFFTLARGEDI